MCMLIHRMHPAIVAAHKQVARGVGRIAGGIGGEGVTMHLLLVEEIEALEGEHRDFATQRLFVSKHQDMSTACSRSIHRSCALQLLRANRKPFAEGVHFTLQRTRSFAALVVHELVLLWNRSEPWMRSRPSAC